MKYQLIENGTSLKIKTPTGEVITTEEAMVEILNLTREIKKHLKAKK